MTGPQFAIWLVSTAAFAATRTAIARLSGPDRVATGAIGTADIININLAELLQGLLQIRVDIGRYPVRFQLLKMID